MPHVAGVLCSWRRFDDGEGPDGKGWWDAVFTSFWRRGRVGRGAEMEGGGGIGGGRGGAIDGEEDVGAQWRLRFDSCTVVILSEKVVYVPWLLSILAYVSLRTVS